MLSNLELDSRIYASHRDLYSLELPPVNPVLTSTDRQIHYIRFVMHTHEPLIPTYLEGYMLIAQTNFQLLAANYVLHRPLAIVFPGLS